MPSIITGLKLGLGQALILVVSAEFVSADTGLGHFIWDSWQVLDIPRMFVGPRHGRSDRRRRGAAGKALERRLTPGYRTSARSIEEHLEVSTKPSIARSRRRHGRAHAGGGAARAGLRRRASTSRRRSFTRLGAGIQMSPNAMRVLRGIGLEPRIRATAFQPRSWTNRDWDTGALTNELPLGADGRERNTARPIC